MGLRFSDLRLLEGKTDIMTTPGIQEQGFRNASFNVSLERHGLNYSNISDHKSMATWLSTTVPQNGGPSFFDTYFSEPRFAMETTLATMATAANVITLAAVTSARCHRTRSVYNKLFVNLAVANILSCVLSWLCNNLLFLFNRQVWTMVMTTFNMCRLFVYLSAAVFVSSAFGIVSTITMLGFTSVQYFAICKPLHHQSIIRTNRVRAYIICSWIMSLICGCVPFLALLFVTERQECAESLLALISDVVIYGVNCCVAIVGTIYIIIVALCLMIYRQIRLLGKRITRFRNERNDVKAERKAFVTIVILLCTLTVFFIPYSVIYVVSLNSSNSSVEVKDQGVIYYMNLLPYLKFLSDPLIYGLRMREVKDGCVRILAGCGFGKCKCLKNEMDRIFHPVPTGNSSFYLQRINSRSTSVS